MLSRPSATSHTPPFPIFRLYISSSVLLHNTLFHPFSTFHPSLHPEFLGSLLTIVLQVHSTPCNLKYSSTTAYLSSSHFILNTPPQHSSILPFSTFHSSLHPECMECSQSLLTIVPYVLLTLCNSTHSSTTLSLFPLLLPVSILTSHSISFAIPVPSLNPLSTSPH